MWDSADSSLVILGRYLPSVCFIAQLAACLRAHTWWCPSSANVRKCDELLLGISKLWFEAADACVGCRTELFCSGQVCGPGGVDPSHVHARHVFLLAILQVLSTTACVCGIVFGVPMRETTCCDSAPQGSVMLFRNRGRTAIVQNPTSLGHCVAFDAMGDTPAATSCSYASFPWRAAHA